MNIAKENDPEEYEIFINTSIEDRLSKINTYDIEKIKKDSTYGQVTLCLHPSRRCNLNCKYCFRESEYLGDEQLTFEVAKDAIDFLVENTLLAQASMLWICPVRASLCFILI